MEVVTSYRMLCNIETNMTLTVSLMPVGCPKMHWSECWGSWRSISSLSGALPDELTWVNSGSYLNAGCSAKSESIKVRNPAATRSLAYELRLKTWKSFHMAPPFFSFNMK